MAYKTLPANWPLDVRYARELEWSEEFPSDLRNEYNTEYNITDLVSVHCEHERRILKARCDMPVGAFLGDVAGTVVKEDELNTDGDVLALYLCSIPALGNLYLDLTQNSNEARYNRIMTNVNAYLMLDICRSPRRITIFAYIEHSFPVQFEC